MLHEIIQLDRPLVSLDFETTGIQVLTDRIIQIGVCKLYPNGDYKEWKTYVNPRMPIPKESMESHGITDEMVRTAPTFQSIHLKFAKALENCDICGYNESRFDIPLLVQEFKRLGYVWEPPRMVDGLRLWMRWQPRNLAAFIEEYIPKEERDAEEFKAHDALHDARWLLRALKGFFLRHTDAPRSVAALNDLFFVAPRDENSLDPEAKLIWKEGKACFGPWSKKHAGKSLQEVRAMDSGYLEWITRENFNPVVKKIVTAALQGQYPAKS